MHTHADRTLSRREMLRQHAVGFGSLALAALLADENDDAARASAGRPKVLP